MAILEIPLDIPDIDIKNMEIIKNEDIIITVVSTVEGTRCHKCGREIVKPYGYGRQIELRHLSILGMNTHIRIRPARYQCTHCDGKPVTTQTLNWYDPRSPHTKVYEEHILLEMVNSTVEDVSIKEDLGYEAVMGIIHRYIETEVGWKEIKILDTIGLDEISLKKGHKDFVTLVTARVDKKITILAVLKGRKKKTVKEFLYSIPKRLKKTVKVVCSDMYEGYINAATEVFGKDVIVIVDRFHVAKLYRKDLDSLRKKEMNRLKKELSEKEYKKLKNVMWILRKNMKKLTDEELEVLKRLFRHSPILEVAYKLCNDLTDIFEDDISKSVATRKIGDWKKNVEESGLKCFNKFLSTLDKYMDKITNYFINRQTSGFVEGLNNKIKVIKRRCYGILNVKHLFQRIHLDLTGYSLYA
ncbi:MAG: ISL3 family transposase [Methanosarcinales archaeon]|nr:ISL3 family transposase [Methanosarcinales archaeon]